MEKTKTGSKTLTGTIRISLRGTGYIRIRNQKDPSSKLGTGDIEIPYESLNTALNGDTVKIITSGKGRGKVIEILKRSKHGFAGALIKKSSPTDGEFVLKASDPKMYAQIHIPHQNLNGAQIGDKVFVTIEKWLNPAKPPLGKVEKVLGRAGEHEAEMQGIILERGFDSSFPPEVEREAEKLKHRELGQAEIKKCRDFRHVTTFTIDPADAKDFDDALSFRKLENGNFEVGVHIADVSHYVQPNTLLDKEALERATSVYLVDRTIPMLPEVLSNDLCSLNPKETKLTFGAVFELDKNGQVLKEWFGKTVINSDKRFTYEEAQKILNDGQGPVRTADAVRTGGLFYEELNTLNQIAKKLTEARIKEGAIVMETEEIKFKLDHEGKPIAVFVKERGDTNKLIEEFMLLANKRVAMYGSKDDAKKDRLFIYRIHDEPDKDKIKDLKEYLKLLGYSLNERRGLVPPAEFNRLFLELEGKNEKGTVQSVVVRSMQKAIYSTKNLGHYGLAFPFYTHFTSPIRRYPDIIAHRLLENYLNGGQVSKEKAGFFQKTAEHCTEREIEAADAERSSVKYKQVEYMAERVGQEFDGIVTGITEWGLYVAEKGSRAEGLVKLRDIESDYYTYDPKKMMLVGQNSSRIMRIGDEIKVSVKKVDIEKQVIDYAIVEEKNNGRKKK